jgi:hypothetical protein
MTGSGSETCVGCRYAAVDDTLLSVAPLHVWCSRWRIVVPDAAAMGCSARRRVNVDSLPLISAIRTNTPLSAR